MPRRRAYWLWFAFSLLLLAPLIVGCSGNPWQRTRWLDQQRLQLPHLQWLAGLSRLHNADGGSGGDISGVSVFRRAGDGVEQALVAQNDVLHVVGLDGSSDHRLAMGTDCWKAMVTPDGRWVTCASHDNGDGDSLQLASLDSAGAVTDAHQAQLDASSVYSLGMWSPDGHYFATVEEAPQCKITVFASPPPHNAFTPVVHITSDAFYTQYDCEVGIVAWSSDGVRLRVKISTGAQAPVLDDVTVGSSLASAVKPSLLDIPATDFHMVDAGLPVDVENWYPASAMLLYLETDTGVESLRGVDPKTGAVKTLVTIPDRSYQIRDYSWTTDGSQVLIVVSSYDCVDCGAAYRSDVYLYTP